MQRPRGKILFLVVGGFFALIGLDLAWGSYYEYQRERDFDHALTAEGVVREKRQENTSTGKNMRSLTSNYVSYAYKVAGKWYLAEDSVGDSIYQNVQQGSAVPVLYVKGKPDDGVLHKPTTGWIPGIIGIPMFLVSLITIAIALRGDAPD
jgi:hypothetical protein